MYFPQNPTGFGLQTSEHLKPWRFDLGVDKVKSFNRRHGNAYRTTWATYERHRSGMVAIVMFMNCKYLYSCIKRLAEGQSRHRSLKEKRTVFNYTLRPEAMV